MRPIDADALMEMVNDTVDMIGNTCVIMNAKDFVRNFIDNLPTIEAEDAEKRVKAKRGKWEPVDGDGRIGKQVKCSCCGEMFWAWMDSFRFCPNCGSKNGR